MNLILNTAAFDPIWGNNPNGEDSFGNNGRTQKPTDGLWGNPDIGESMPKAGGPQSDSLLQAVFNYSVDIKTILDFYYDLKEQLWGEEEAKQVSNSEGFIFEEEKAIDTTRFNVKRTLLNHNKVINRSESTVIGRENARKDSAYHTDNVKGSLKIEVKIERFGK